MLERKILSGNALIHLGQFLYKTAEEWDVFRNPESGIEILQTFRAIHSIKVKPDFESDHGCNSACAFGHQGIRRFSAFRVIRLQDTVSSFGYIGDAQHLPR